MSVSQFRIGRPHDLLQLQKLGQKTGDLVINLLRMCRDYVRRPQIHISKFKLTVMWTLTLRMLGCSLNIPDRVRLDSLFVTRHFLLLVRPFRELDSVREEITARHQMTQLEVRA